MKLVLATWPYFALKNTEKFILLATCVLLLGKDVRMTVGRQLAFSAAVLIIHVSNEVFKKVIEEQA
jgi:hypothetical protein